MRPTSFLQDLTWPPPPNFSILFFLYRIYLFLDSNFFLMAFFFVLDLTYLSKPTSLVITCPVKIPFLMAFFLCYKLSALPGLPSVFVSFVRLNRITTQLQCGYFSPFARVLTALSNRLLYILILRRYASGRLPN